MWSSPFQIVNSEVKDSYINPEFQNIQKRSGLRLAVLTFEHLKPPHAQLILSAPSESSKPPSVTKTAHIQPPESTKYAAE